MDTETDFAACVGDACASGDALWDAVPELPNEVAPAVLEAEVFREDETHWSPEEEEKSETSVAEYPGPGLEPVWLEPPVQFAEPPVHDEQGLAADTSASAHFTNCLCFRLVSGTARSQDLHVASLSMGEGGSAASGPRDPALHALPNDIGKRNRKKHIICTQPLRRFDSKRMTFSQTRSPTQTYVQTHRKLRVWYSWPFMKKQDSGGGRQGHFRPKT